MFIFYLLYYAAVLIKFTYYAQSLYALILSLLSLSTHNINTCMNKSVLKQTI